MAAKIQVLFDDRNVNKRRQKKREEEFIDHFFVCATESKRLEDHYHRYILKNVHFDTF